MARDLGLDEVVDHFTLNSEETGWLRNKTGATRLGFAVQMKFLLWRGRFPKMRLELPRDAVAHIARQQRLYPRLPPRQRRQSADPGQDPLVRARRVQRLRLAQQREERAHRGVPVRQRGPHGDLRRVLVLGHQRDHRGRRGHHGGARGDLLHRRPQRGHVQVHLLLLDQLQLLEQHLRRPREHP
ncbi:DUF4158 domain-containing protein [Streptosporangium sp. NBC_01639]|uniref:DUF4158 domain-containing protein n=1 Tax=Streptosporangium sp. NBC_01639 TaxID=2975948 RepID=UPI00386F7F8F|nr:DUF4158 domain-containing protein [Streptosporangium sp. NBC_01639]